MTSLKKLQILQTQVLATIKDLKEKSFDRYGVSPEMKISYDLESIRTLGTANYHKGVMRLNKYLLMEFGELYIKDVVVHEYAHFVVDARRENGEFRTRNVRPHGIEFKSVCSFFGISGKATTNSFNNSQYLKSKRNNMNSNKKVFYYGCDCKIPHELSATKHNKITRGCCTYSCKNCKRPLKFIKQKSRSMIG